MILGSGLLFVALLYTSEAHGFCIRL